MTQNFLKVFDNLEDLSKGFMNEAGLSFTKGGEKEVVEDIHTSP